MNRLVVATALCLLPLAPAAAPAAGAGYTGDVLVIIYVSDVEASVPFYRDVLGFEFLGFWDYEADGYVPKWTDAEPPRYAGFAAAGRKFGLHRPANESQRECVGCGSYYFRVRDVEAEHARISDLGVEVGPIRSSPLLKRFHVTDPDGLAVFLAETAAGAPSDPW